MHVSQISRLIIKKTKKPQTFLAFSCAAAGLRYNIIWLDKTLKSQTQAFSCRLLKHITMK